MSINDFKSVFKTLDYNNTDEIDFYKFCLINTDKSNCVYELIEDIKLENQYKKKNKEVKTITDLGYYFEGNPSQKNDILCNL